ncbi:hypothetical protein BU24DRAFT_410181 [Aaosphaeria arxii CBS 175.79]|uniref:Rhodopsin domain-containing protein n=1 Tax=Aaosphaeria arxii CBS 175.79 TaxID=1450172 RepID=A0A6A5XMG4_9PLEO|nr:uncharacterized protein BU24DRAFT_410181 [Aaosphaeria arxii CBS 175.79]KAF2014435.1 hypothetical protein BU24DRAFT_410181 [Aaosphaeria arxii CBS 175.79]
MSSKAELHPPPTHINNAHRKWDTTIFIIVLLIIAGFTTIARLTLRFRARLFGYDDWAMIPALAGYIAHSVLGAYVNARAGIEKPLWEVSIQEFELWLKGIAISQFLYPLTSGLIRIAILLFYDRVFSKASKPMRFAIRITIALTIIYIITFVIYAGFLCKPIHKFWKPFERARYCGDNILKWIYDAAVYSYSLVLDLILLILPVFPILRLQLSGGKKFGAITMFTLGASACIAATYKLAVFGLQWNRMGYIDPRWANQQLALVIPPQFDSYGYTMWIPTQAELSAAMIGSSLIALKPYLQRFARSAGSKVGAFIKTVQQKSQCTSKDNYSGLRSTSQRLEDSSGGFVGVGVGRDRGGRRDPYIRMHSGESQTALNDEFELTTIRRENEGSRETQCKGRGNREGEREMGREEGTDVA